MVLSFAAIYVIWGGTYILNHWALDSFPPFVLAGSRFLIAGLILSLFYWSHANETTLQAYLSASGIGILLLGIGTGAITYALQYIDTGLAALVVAFEPLIVVLLMWLVLNKKPTWMAGLGCALGIVGMYLLVSQKQVVTNENTLYGMMLIMVSLFSWAIGSVYMSKLVLPESKGLSASVQMIASGLFLLISSLIVGEDQARIFHDFSWSAMLAWLTLVFFGSIIAYSAFNYLLIKSTPDKVATTTYVNPVVALLLGWSLNNEEVSAQSLVAAAVLLSGVFFINMGKRRIRKVKWKN